MKRLMSLSLAVLLACSAEQPGSDEAAQGPQIEGRVQSLFTDPARTLNIVAHQDDDLGLMVPTLARTIRANATVQTIYVTAGDAGFGCDSYFQKREQGIKFAYEEIAGLTVGDPGNWMETMEVVNGKHIRKVTMTGKPVSLMFIGLPNAAAGAPNLLDLWTNTTTTQLTTVPDSRRGAFNGEVYSREVLIATLQQMIQTFDPGHINTLDSSRIWDEVLPFEHYDHVASALFALAAKQRIQGTQTLREHRAYNMLAEDDNISPSDAALKTAVFNRYTPQDRKICSSPFLQQMCDANPGPEASHEELCDDPDTVYTPFLTRQYTIGPVMGVQGGIRGPSTTSTPLCLQTNSATIALAACSPGAAAQTWSLQKDGTLRNSAGLCATNGAANPRGMGITLSACLASGNTRGQKFMLTSEGKLRGPDATCAQASGTDLTLRECDGVASQLSFSMQASSAVYTARNAGWSDAEVPDNLAHYNTFSLADIDADGDADACVRRHDGVYCSVNAGGTPPLLGAPTRWTSAFGSGWSDPSMGSTVTLADINGDSRADVCGRHGNDGIVCGLSNGSSFALPTKRSSGVDFSNWVGYQLTASVYGAIRFVDVNNAGGLDVCSRNANGIECALNNGSGSFGPVSQWISSEFTDALGWRNDEGGTTLRFADIDGDGRQDVCGRGALGIICAVNVNGTRFDDAHLWSEAEDFAVAAGWSLNRSYYGSIRLADINGDGKADVCGRGVDGIVCSVSLGAAFGPEQQYLSVNPYDDATGWTPARYGSNVQLGDLDKDGRVDLCARGPIPGAGVGIRCVLGARAAP